MTTTGQTHTTAEDAPILVLSGTGKTGSRVAERLRERGLPVRIGSRTATPAFDWEDRSTWAAALDGVRAVWIAYVPDLAVPGAAETIDAFSRQAVAAGVQRLVLLSGRGEPEAQRSERIVQEAGADWTIVRASWFAQNFSEGFMADFVAAGEIVLPADGIPEPFVDVDDIADVAVAALTEEGHAGRLYEVTGPRLLTFAEAVAEIGRAAGRELRYVPVPLDAFLAGAAEQGVPHDALGLLRMLFGELLDGRNASTADGVEQALGRPPRDFADYAARTAAGGAWAG